ncbi:MAG: alpha/beta hydrolase [Gammaproteobacteria bacterium]|nr:alpha/beta hydrolase [Gammaproteobacteria bacterium]
MKKERLQIATERGHVLAAQLDSPADRTPVAYAVFCHCFTCGKNLKAIGNISRVLTEAGLAVLRFDFTGIGESGGEFSETGFTDNVNDILAVSRYLEQEYQGPALLVGHSLGGTAAIAAAPEIKSCVAIATIASPLEPGDVARRFLDKKPDVERNGHAQIQIGGISYKIKDHFFAALERESLRTTLESLDKALLILHSPADETVSIAEATRLYSAARHPKSFVSLDNIDHLMSHKKDAEYVGGIIAAWVKHYL